MKALIIKLVLLMLIIMNQSACRTEKLLNSQKSRSSKIEKEDTRIQSKADEFEQSHRMIVMSDSSDQFYQVNILPLDTFSFSLQDGFKGKASKIEVIGAKHEVNRFSDSVEVAITKQRDLRYNRVGKIKKQETSGSRILEKSGTMVRAGIIGIGLLILAGWICWRFWKYA